MVFITTTQVNQDEKKKSSCNLNLQKIHFQTTQNIFWKYIYFFDAETVDKFDVFTNILNISCRDLKIISCLEADQIIL